MNDLRKVMGALIAVTMLCASFFSPQAQAASAIKVYINGVELATDQPPIMVGSRVLVPMRAIFEALDANIGWNSKEQIVTATKGAMTVVLKIGSQTATINNKTVTLDVPAQVKNNRTLVPVRFATEALGEDVNWNSSTQSVLITTSATKQVDGASFVTATANGQFGDGRDVKISFAPPEDTAYIKQYRIMVVKSANAASFTLAKAQAATSDKYTTVSASYSGQYTSLTAQTKDVDGAVLRSNQAYKVFVMTVGEVNNVLSAPSKSIELKDNTLVDVATNVRISDVNDYGDGRDLSVSFTKANNDSNISSYRVMIVRTADASKFNLDAANRVTSNYTTVYKTSSSIMTAILNSSSRDTSGQLLQNGIPYTAFILSVASNSNYTNNLSAASPSVTLSTSILAPVITSVSDIANNGNGSDLQISFNKASNESFISKYRIFVVPESDFYSFDVAEANKVASGRYTDVSKTGDSITLTLASNARDVKGNAIANNIAYRIFVMGISSNSTSVQNALSVPSASMALINTGISPVTNVTVRDVSDNNNGQDMQISFNKAPSENNIGYYRIFVVKSSDVKYFNFATAVAISNSNNGYFTTVYKTGSNITTNLPANARDWNGTLIQNGISYQVFVLSVGTGSYNGIHALSSPSTDITLNSASLPTVTNMTVSDISDFGNGQDLRIAFNKPSNESNINQYRIFVVRNESAGSFTLATANAITNSNLYTTVNKTGSNISTTLPPSAVDILGVPIQNGISYRVFVMSVGNGLSSLSSYSSAITLAGTNVPAATNVTVSDVGDLGTGQDLQISFTKASSETNISQYRIFIVKSAYANSFNLATANSITNSSNYTNVAKTGANISVTLAAAARDTNGDLIQNGIGYSVFVMSVASGNGNTNALSASSSAITLTINTVSPVTNVVANDVGDQSNGQDLRITFIKAANETNINQYRIFVVKSANVGSFNLATANSITNSNYTNVAKTGGNISLTLSAAARDTNGDLIQNGTTYYVFVMSVASGNGNSNVLSASSAAITLTITPVSSVTDIVAKDIDDQGNGQDLQVTFALPATESNIAHYRVYVVNASTPGSFDLDAALGTSNYTFIAIGKNSVTLATDATDITGASIQNGVTYQVYVLSYGSNPSASTLSSASNSIVLTTPTE